MLKLSLLNIFNSHNSLGEGILAKNGRAIWVDINLKEILVYCGKLVDSYSTESHPSIIFDFDDYKIDYGSKRGIQSICLKTKKETLIQSRPSILPNDYRSNDGCICGNFKLLSFMHSKEPSHQNGYIFTYIDERWELIDHSLFIPNSFIEIEPFKVLISDSSKSEIWLYELNEDGTLKNKTLWSKIDPKISPDGGCLVGEYILIAFWDGASIGVFNKEGNLLDTLSIPVLRPTNCKYDKSTSQLWVTSASEGLTKKQEIDYPNSGNTFLYQLKFTS